jgi:hypothetical protein
VVGAIEERIVICRNCLQENPPQNHYCGNCGTAFEVAPTMRPAAPSRSFSTDNPAPEASLHGPSFLGLSSDLPDEAAGLSYLTDEEPEGGGHWRLVAALLVAAGFAAFLVWQWRQNPSWQTALYRTSEPWPPKIVTAPAPPPFAMQKSGPQAEAAAGASTTSTDTAAEHNPETPAQESHQNSSAEAEAGSDAAQDASAERPQPAGAPSVKVHETPGEQMFVKGRNYLYGTGGVAKNCQQALIYLRNAADLGNTHARSQLGALYATGHCVPLDRAQAYEWFTLAHSGRDAGIWVEHNRQMLWSQMSEDERRRAMAAYQK